RQVGELRTLTSGEVVLGASTQLRDTGQIDLHRGGQLRHLVQGLHHPLADDLADARHLLFGAALRGDLDLRRGRSSRRGRRGGSRGCGLLRLDRLLDVLLADATAEPGALTVDRSTPASDAIFRTSGVT